MNELLFDTPWWLPAVVAGGGIVIFITGNKHVENRVRAAGAGLVLLSVLILAVSYFVDTAMETAERKTEELVDAFEKADWAVMSSILDPNASITVLSYNVYPNRESIISAAKDAHARYGFKSANVFSSTAVQADSVITVSILLLSEQSNPGYTLNSRWEFEWQQSQEGWALVNIRAIQIGQTTGPGIRSLFPGR